MSDIERAAFEQAVADNWSDSYSFTRFGDEDYYDEVLEGMWRGWQASRQALEGEPVMWSLQFDNGPVNHFTTYPTLEKAENYAALCNIGKDKSNIKIIPLYTRPASCSEIPNSSDAASAVPEGWTIEPFDEGIIVLWPGDRGGAHLRPNDPKNSIAQNLLYDLAQTLLLSSPTKADEPVAAHGS